MLFQNIFLLGLKDGIRMSLIRNESGAIHTGNVCTAINTRNKIHLMTHIQTIIMQNEWMTRPTVVKCTQKRKYARINLYDYEYDYYSLLEIIFY